MQALITPSTRPPEPESLEAFAALHAASFITPPPWSLGEISSYLSLPHAFALQIGAAGKIQGFLIGTVIAGEAELVTLAVAPSHRRQGLGLALLLAFIEEAKARGAETAFLEVSAENPAAIALYESQGFTRIGLRRGYYKASPPIGPAIDAVVMSLALTQGGEAPNA